MKSRQDGEGVAPYAAETAREMRNLGAGGDGNFERLQDASLRGVTRDLVDETARRAEIRIEQDRQTAASKDKKSQAARQRY